MPGTVGVAPGTLTIQLEGCPPDPHWVYMTPPGTSYGGLVRPAAAGGAALTTFEPYGTESKLMGATLRGVDPQKMRWDIVALVGGTTFLVALTLGLIATRR